MNNNNFEKDFEEVKKMYVAQFKNLKDKSIKNKMNNLLDKMFDKYGFNKVQKNYIKFVDTYWDK